MHTILNADLVVPRKRGAIKKLLSWKEDLFVSIVCADKWPAVAQMPSSATFWPHLPPEFSGYKSLINKEVVIKQTTK